MSLGQKMMDPNLNKFDTWNNHQVFGGQDLAMSYAETSQF